MKKVLIGTTNPAKVKRFEQILKDYDAEFITLSEAGITDEPTETGDTPGANAAAKAEFYGRYYDRVLCNDSGLYFDCLDKSDPRQPGLHIRTPYGTERLNDEQAIAYYSELVKSLGGRVLAYYVDGFAVKSGDKLYTYEEPTEVCKCSAFYMVDKPSKARHVGWPLDSISLNRNSLTYFTDDRDETYDNNEQIIVGEYFDRLVEFFANALGLTRKA